ncbi:hypothetical protein [Streptomyces violaceorubidus]|uniref:hypothetical protein n=1 Tax=Streptomyces violaceorubidus TaxID=284042 RepID=UPI0007C6D788|nr:hypothetical protein [Streptomyces violaceorubidus]
MRNTLLRSVLAAAFSVVVAVGALTGLSGAKAETRADSTWGMTATTVASSAPGAEHAPLGEDDSTWG